MRSQFKNIEIDEELMHEIKGIIATLCSICHTDDLMVEPQDLYFTLSVLREKYRELLIQIGFVKRDELYSGMTFDRKDAEKVLTD